MSKSVEAVYENGVLRPLEPIDLPEHQRVTVTIWEAPGEEWLDTDCLQSCANEVDDSVTLEAVRKALSKIPGSLTADFISERDEP
ncbi:antitoxin family protein [Acidobacteria bacterium AH-259-L09]|nr:antitoxin family protein [Acidobacteria bacterium AH-259-L09]